MILLRLLLGKILKRNSLLRENSLIKSGRFWQTNLLRFGMSL
jgi:hypothetical protein